MLKRFGTILGVLVFLIGINSEVLASPKTVGEVINEQGYELSENYYPKSSLVIEVETGRIIWQENIDQVYKTASLSSLMTVYLLLEEQGEKSLGKEIEVQEKDVKLSQNQNLSNTTMSLGTVYKIEELVKLMMGPSSAAASMMLADYISGNDQEKFVGMMNETAEKLGMNQTKFYNCIGVPNADLGEFRPNGGEDQSDKESTARDLAILTQQLLKKYPQVLGYTKEREVIVGKGTESEEKYVSKLYALPGGEYAYEGFDGLKAASTQDSGYNLIGTAKRNETRFVEVLLGVGDLTNPEGEKMRFIAGNALFDIAFKNYEYVKIADKGKKEVEGQNLMLETDYYDVIPIGQEPKLQVLDGKVQIHSFLANIYTYPKDLGVSFNDPKQTSKTEKKQAKSPKKKKGSSIINILVSFLKILLFILLGVISLGSIVLNVVLFKKVRKLEEEKRLAIERKKERQEKRRQKKLNKKRKSGQSTIIDEIDIEPVDDTRRNRFGTFMR